MSWPAKATLSLQDLLKQTKLIPEINLILDFNLQNR